MAFKTFFRNLNFASCILHVQFLHLRNDGDSGLLEFFILNFPHVCFKTRERLVWGNFSHPFLRILNFGVNFNFVAENVQKLSVSDQLMKQ